MTGSVRGRDQLRAGPGRAGLLLVGALTVSVLGGAIAAGARWSAAVPMVGGPLLGLVGATSAPFRRSAAPRWSSPRPGRGGATTVLSTTAASVRPTRVRPEPVAEPAPELLLTVTQLTWVAHDVVELLLSNAGGTELPGWQPGAHIQLRLPSGRVRHYSLYGDPTLRSHYRIAVLRKPNGRGGSREIHELPVGATVPVGQPRNGFALRPAPAFLFIAGGIGITGLLPMARALAATPIPWRLVYTGSSAARMPLLDQVAALDPDRVRIVTTSEHGRVDLAGLLDAQAPGTAVYCCGPAGMLDEVSELVGRRPALRLHTERFEPAGEQTEPGRPLGSPVRLELRRSGKSVVVPAEQTLLRSISGLVPQLAGGCEQGVCGRCQVIVLAGEPEHRDTLLTERQRQSGHMLLCVSRARGPRLTLDL